MDTVILTLHIVLAVFLIGVILLQRSEGGALGIGGGGGGGLMGGRSAASALTRTTVVLAAGFFATSFALGFLAEPRGGGPTGSVIEDVDDTNSDATAPAPPAEGSGESPAGESAEPDARPEPPATAEPEPADTPTPPESQ